MGNENFCSAFDSLLTECHSVEGGGVRPKIDSAWRVVNGRDVVARLPRTINAAVFGRVGYDHCGKTALVSPLEVEEKLWLEDVSDEVRADGQKGEGGGGGFEDRRSEA